MNKLEFINKTYLQRGFKIFPVIENGKQPLIDAWQRECSSDFLQVLYWLENAKGCNVGLPANENNLFIIDIDMHDINGKESFEKLCRDLEIDEVDTLMQTTPSGGIHYIFQSDEDLKKVVNSANCFKDYQGIDIRTKGYILVEPSVINGVPYKLDMREIKEVPSNLKKFIIENNKEIEIKHKEEYIKPEKVVRGNRDSSLFIYINQLYYKTRLDKEEITLLAHNFNRNICEPPLSDSVVNYKVNKLFKKHRNKYILINIDEERNEVESEI